MTDEELLQQFVNAFGKLADMVVYPHLIDHGAMPAELDNGRDDSQWANQLWKPAAVATDAGALAAVYNKLPGRLPPLYEQLALSYRWLEIELFGFARLKTNPPGPSLSALVAKITADPVLVRVLFPLGLVPFGRAADDNYDPLCFDLARRQADGDCHVVRVEHESVLCHERVGDSWQIFDWFRALVESVIAKAQIA